MHRSNICEYRSHLLPNLSIYIHISLPKLNFQKAVYSQFIVLKMINANFSSKQKKFKFYKKITLQVHLPLILEYPVRES